MSLVLSSSPSQWAGFPLHSGDRCSISGVLSILSSWHLPLCFKIRAPMDRSALPGHPPCVGEPWSASPILKPLWLLLYVGIPRGMLYRVRGSSRRRRPTKGGWYLNQGGGVNPTSLNYLGGMHARFNSNLIQIWGSVISRLRPLVVGGAWNSEFRVVF